MPPGATPVCDMRSSPCQRQRSKPSVESGSPNSDAVVEPRIHFHNRYSPPGAALSRIIRTLRRAGAQSLGGPQLDGSPSQTKQNLEQIIETAHKKGARVLLTGMLAPPNMGELFQAEFKAVYPELAAKYQVTFLPFLLEGIAGHPELNQEDGIHPTAAGQRMIADMIYPLLQPLADDMLSR